MKALFWIGVAVFGCSVAFLGVMVGVLALCGSPQSRPAPVTTSPAPQEALAAPERRQLLRPETHAALRANVERMDTLAAEARCKSSAARLKAGECD